MWTAQRIALVEKGAKILDEAGAAGKLTADQKSQLDELEAQIKAGDELASTKSHFDTLLAGTGGPRKESLDGGPQAAKSLGDFYVAELGEKGLAALGTKGATLSTGEWLPEQAKANTDTHFTPAGMSEHKLTGLFGTQLARPVIADLLSEGSLSGSVLKYWQDSNVVEGEFGTVADGDAKPQIHFGKPEEKSETVSTIAAWWDTHQWMLEDAEFWKTEIETKAIRLLALAEEKQIMTGDGTGANLTGLLNVSGVQTVTTAAAAEHMDAIYQAAMNVQTATDLTADGVIMNPADYARLRLSKDGNGQYLGGGPFAGQYGVGGIQIQPPLWGLPTVVTSAIPAGTALVGALKQAVTLYRKGGVRLESTNSDANKFTKNIVTTRAEERVAMAVFNPMALAKVTLG